MEMKMVFIPIFRRDSLNMFCEIHLQKFSRDTLIDYVQQNVPRMLESNGQCFKHRISLHKSEQF